jgi:hypothetical protein
MCLLRLFITIIILASFGTASGQEFQNSVSYRNIGADHYFRLNYENDLFFGTDYYFTQGVHFELVNPKIGKLPMRKVLLRPDAWSMRYGISLESAGYTPTTIFADSILYGDRPFAGMSYLKAFTIATDSIKRRIVSSTLTVGLMGPDAGGYEIQAAIHRRTGNADPTGWKYQVSNNIILNYEVTYEQALFTLGNYLLVTGVGMIRAGTHNTKAGIGTVVMIGVFHDPFVSGKRRRGPFGYVYAHPEVNLVGYDATLQGGPFSKASPYVIASGDISRITFRSDVGAMCGYGSMTLGGYMRYVSKEFRSGMQHFTGGFQLGISFD